MNEIPDVSSVLARRLADAPWRTSTRSQTSNCVEVAPLRGGPAAVALRDSKDRGGPVLLFDRAGWAGFLAGTKNGQFDLS
ncbi:DUF397 domain-containing protein [Micromonospora carbonacea]|jgi:hypothetical protein|uniref:DUF397 domain-containing protein n=1 Tax=Micromonospora carbonacea TaxID=47853 RepID=A0A1C4UQ45_9ACTN|nr:MULTISPECIES: DUF397 domain-containing protein [Micromonospora]MBB5824473.1 hypothetical protein [Micromonospora carbonacea]MDG4815291.1 DUF397 domain-containing protein [Micromonospora sp. WMMD956]QLD27330.1 DUF397 domain-containing protein [Micromonospora carbonacea]WFE57873.1 DUF397 domain-containing protein [Micromonospora sp. WMMD712]SCE73754.1 protein of unknown function (DUF397) [Micromonospora carbonacea]